MTDISATHSHSSDHIEIMDILYRSTGYWRRIDSAHPSSCDDISKIRKAPIAISGLWNILLHPDDEMEMAVYKRKGSSVAKIRPQLLMMTPIYLPPNCLYPSSELVKNPTKMLIIVAATNQPLTSAPLIVSPLFSKKPEHLPVSC